MSLNGKKVLITGAAGFIGSNLLRAILKRYSKVDITIIIKPSTNLWRIKDLVKRVRILKNDLLDKSLLEKKMKDLKPDIIFHLATADYHSDNLDQLIKVNTLGTLNLIFALEEIDYQIFINIGTSSEYGSVNHLMSEGNPLFPNSYYAATKAANTILLSTYAKLKNKPIITIRPFSVYGPYEIPGRLMSANIIKALRNHPIKIPRDKTVMDFIYVDDLVELLFKCIKLKIFTNFTFNAATGKGSSIEQVVEIIKRLTKSKSIILKDYQKSSWHQSFWVGSNKLAQKRLGWKPRYNLEKGLIKTVRWFKQNQDLYE